MKVPFLSLVPGDDAAAVRAAIERVVASGWFILGPEVEAFEHEFATACGSAHAISVGTGTDAIALALRALGIGPGDEVITSPVSAAFSALAIQMAGATPVFADVDPERFTMTPEATAAAVTSRTAAIMPVHLYGQPADMTGLIQVAARHGLAVVEDACQAHFATCESKPIGTYGIVGAFSFYPTKNLGALGDGGAIITSDSAIAAKLQRLRNGGQSGKYQHAEFGVNSRLDEMQAAILRARLPFMAQWTHHRRQLAAEYRKRLTGASVTVPREFDSGHVYHLFVVLTRNREGFQAHLAANGVGTLVHYPISIPRQPAMAGLAPASCPVADRVVSEVVSLPLHQALTDDDVRVVADAVNAWRG